MPSQTRRAVALLLASAAACAALAQNVPIATNADDRFDRLDVNHDDVLSRYEMDSEILIGVLDVDGDQLVSAAELLPLLGPDVTPATAHDRVLVADRNADDMLDESELARASKMRFEWMDANKDGNVDRAELRERFLVKMVSGP
jgi:hypothetical protein